MKQAVDELRKLKGIGEVLAKRFIEAGYDTPGKVAHASIEDLGKIPGVNPRMLPQLVIQAAALVEEAEKSSDEKNEELKQKAALLKGHIEEIARDVRDRFSEGLSGKAGARLEKQIHKFILSLEKVEGKLKNRAKKVRKGLARAEKRLVVVSEDGLREIGKKVKKARKSLKRVYS
ncbi:MAG: hypothetical protein H6Q57_2036 [Geobacteraceae bacterium]|nr:hypothetical protein [Geobacteraceae bacterium]